LHPYKAKKMKKEIIKGFVYFEGVKTGLHIDSIKEMSFEDFKLTFQGKIQYTSQAKELQPELRKIYEGIAGKKKVTRRKASK